MKKILTICLIAALMPLHAGAQSSKSEIKENRELQKLITNGKSRYDAKTIDKLTDLKLLAGKTICLRPDYTSSSLYGRYSESELTIKKSKYVPLLNQEVTETTTFKKGEKLVVEKVKKNELTVLRGDEKLKISSEHYNSFMLESDAEDVTSSIIAEYNQEKIDEANAKKAAEEKALKEKAEREAAVLQGHLEIYYQNLEHMPKAIEGPIAVVIPERAYSGEVPYWKSGVSYNQLDTYRDEKFVLSPHRFPQLYAKYKERIEKGSTSSEAQQVARLSALQKDTFGIYSRTEFIDLRTGEVFKDMNLIPGLWESVNYLNLLKDVEVKPYDGTISLNALLKDVNAPYREKIIESLIGERVFLLDELKYDYITAIEERNISGGTTLYLKDNGKLEYWQNECISVKWYEQLQKYVGKKVIYYDDLNLWGFERIWREDLPKRPTYTVVKFEVKDNRLNMILKSNEGSTKTLDAYEYCDYLAYPINIDHEWNIKQSKRKCLLDNRTYFYYDAVWATTPRKPANIKKQEAEDKARSAEISAQWNKLREHKLIGTSLAQFTSQWPNAQLTNTTSSDGVTIQVYRIYDYRLVFRNGYCVSQTTY